MNNPNAYKLKAVFTDPQKLKPYIKNNKIHDEKQIDKIAESISQFGFDQPIVVNEQLVIIKGHGRYLAALKLGLKEVPIAIRKDLSQIEQRASRMADNRVSIAPWNAPNLRDECEYLDSLSLDVEKLTQFDLPELEKIAIPELNFRNPIEHKKLIKCPKCETEFTS